MVTLLYINILNKYTCMNIRFQKQISVLIVAVLLRPSMRSNAFNHFLILIAFCDATVMAMSLIFDSVSFIFILLLISLSLLPFPSIGFLMRPIYNGYSL